MTLPCQMVWFFSKHYLLEWSQVLLFVLFSVWFHHFPVVFYCQIWNFIYVFVILLQKSIISRTMQRLQITLFWTSTHQCHVSAVRITDRLILLFLFFYFAFLYFYCHVLENIFAYLCFEWEKVCVRVYMYVWMCALGIVNICE